MTPARIRKLAERAGKIKQAIKEGHADYFDARMLETCLYEMANEAETGIWTDG